MRSTVHAANMPSMLCAVLRELERVHVEEGAGAGSTPSLALWSNMVRVLDEPVQVRDLQSRTRLSTRAVKSHLAQAIREGWVQPLQTGSAVQRTAQGQGAVRRWRAVSAHAEKRWSAEIGENAAAGLRASLASLVARFPLEHPHYPAGYGAVDASITGGGGRDWKPVPRSGGGEDGLPLSALLSQAVVNFAMVYEQHADVAFALATRVLTKLPAEGRTLAGLAPTAWLSTLERHRYVHRTGKHLPSGPVFVLTDRGSRCASRHEQLIAQTESSWTSDYGAQLVAKLRQALVTATRPRPAAQPGNR